MTTLYSALYDDSANVGQLPYITDYLACVEPWQMVKKDALLILHGGEDINPAIYGQKANSHVHTGKELSPRDVQEIAFANRAKEMGIPILGICRGAQLVCGLSGGSLVQHVSGHNGSRHWIVCSDGSTILGNSYHHQMMNPSGSEHEILGATLNTLSKTYLGENDEEIPMLMEPEIVFFPEWRCLAVQGHPEWMPRGSLFVKHVLGLISQKLFST